MAMKLYGMGASTCSRRVITTIHEKGGDFELVPIDLSKGEHKTPEFLKMQPFGVIPVLVDGDVTVYESRAIARYVCNKYAGQGTNLLGSTLAQKAAVDQWLEVESQNYNAPCSGIVFEKMFKLWRGGATDPALVEQYRAKLSSVLDIYEARLTESKYLAGDFFSLADLSHIPYTACMVQVGDGDLIESRPHVKAWWEDITSRPSWKKASS